MTVNNSDRYLSLYYFHGQDLCMVPRHVREDVAWMKDHCVNGVFIGVHDADLLGGNTAMVCDIVREAGLDVWLIPSRIGGMMAGWGRQPSYLSVNHPEWWSLNADGAANGYFGPQLSIFHPEVPGAVADTVKHMLERFPATGIVWDEIKTMWGEDHSPAAVDVLGRPALESDLLQGTVECFSSINRQIKEVHPDLKIASFIYAMCSEDRVEACASIEGLDEFGCDGKCFKLGESAIGEGGEDKVLFGGNDARFAEAARRHDCTPFTLLETQLLDRASLEITVKNMPEFLAHKTGHLVTYYYPYGMEDPDHFMPILGEAIAAWRTGASESV